jgi:membrane associated rhomboid family serine protease
MYPDMPIGFFLIPIKLPGWIFGIIYLGFSIYGMLKNVGNIGHDAHMGGAAVGLIMTVAFAPELLFKNLIYIGLMTIPLIVLAYLVWKRK